MQQFSDKTIELLKEPSFYTDNNYHTELFQGLFQSLDDAELRALKSLVFVLIKPDAVASGKMHAVVDHLERNELAVVFAKALHSCQLVQFEELYKFNLTKANSKNQLGSWWLNSQTYLMGPVVGLLVAGKCPGEAGTLTAHQLVNSLKGPSTPHFGVPGTLRFDLRATNRAVNLLHVSDDPFSTAREFSIFFGEELFRRMLRSYCHAERLNELKIWAKADLRRAAITMGPQAQELDFLRVLLRVKARLFAELVDAAAEDAALGGLWTLIEDLGAIANGSDDLRSRVSRYQALSTAFQKHLRAFTNSRSEQATTEQRVVYESLLTAFDLASLDEPAARRLFNAMESNGVAFSPWERLVIFSTVHYVEDYQALFR